MRIVSPITRTTVSRAGAPATREPPQLESGLRGSTVAESGNRYCAITCECDSVVAATSVPSTGQARSQLVRGTAQASSAVIARTASSAGLRVGRSRAVRQHAQHNSVNAAQPASAIQT